MSAYLILEFAEHSNLALKLGQLWWQGPDDLHIQFPERGGFGGKYGDNYWPTFKQGDYWAPDPTDLRKSCRLEGMTVQSGLQGCKRASPAYQAALEKFWKSPNK